MKFRGFRGACEVQPNRRMKLSNAVQRFICEHGEIDEFRVVLEAGGLAFAAYAQSRYTHTSVGDWYGFLFLY